MHTWGRQLKDTDEVRKYSYRVSRTLLDRFSIHFITKYVPGSVNQMGFIEFDMCRILPEWGPDGLEELRQEAFQKRRANDCPVPRDAKWK